VRFARAHGLTVSPAGHGPRCGVGRRARCSSTPRARRVRRPPRGLGPRRRRREVGPRRRGRDAARPCAPERLVLRRRRRRATRPAAVSARCFARTAWLRPRPRLRGRDRGRRAAARQCNGAPRPVLRPARRQGRRRHRDGGRVRPGRAARASTVARCTSPARTRRPSSSAGAPGRRRCRSQGSHVLRLPAAAPAALQCPRRWPAASPSPVRYVWTGDAESGEAQLAGCAPLPRRPRRHR
jgi:hypothetical protein